MGNLITEAEVNNLFNKIVKRNKSAKFYKADLHVHSPASKCYLKKDPQRTDDEEYELFLLNIINSDVDIIAITDHNTVKDRKSVV